MSRNLLTYHHNNVSLMYQEGLYTLTYITLFLCLKEGLSGEGLRRWNLFNEWERPEVKSIDSVPLL